MKFFYLQCRRSLPREKCSDAMPWLAARPCQNLEVGSRELGCAPCKLRKVLKAIRLLYALNLGALPQSQLGHVGVHFHVLAIKEPLSACLLQQSSTLPPPIIRNLKARSENEDPEWKWPACAPRLHRHASFLPQQISFRHDSCECFREEPGPAGALLVVF